jgi:HD superfamily phosphohydrolase
VRIRDPIHGSIAVSDAETEIVDSRFYQRLRNVRQLGFGDLAFPGATHTRHAHCLGAMHVASRVFDAVAARSTLSPQAKERFRAMVRLAVLCHDLGHMPLSHASESIAPARASLKLPAWVGPGPAQATHEDFTARILLDSSLTPILRRAYAPMGITPELAAALVNGQRPPGADFVEGGVDWAPALRALVSGELDADRMDYLLRDSFYTGVNYGRYDIDWILQNLGAVERDGQAVLALSTAAIFAFEDFLLSRYHMFLGVYYHHTSVSFDHMLQRYYAEAPDEFSIPSDPEAFLLCDDVALLTALRASKNVWAQRIVERRGFKRVAQFTDRDEGYDLGQLDTALTQAGLEHFTIESRGVLSRYFESGASPSLFVFDPSSGRLTEVARYTPLYQRFAGAVRLSRIYVRPDQAAAARPIVARLLSTDAALTARGPG